MMAFAFGGRPLFGAGPTGTVGAGVAEELAGFAGVEVVFLSVADLKVGLACC